MGQSYAVAVGRTLACLSRCVAIIRETTPDLLLVNGPGTCLPVCFAALWLRWLSGYRIRIVFVESICRVTSLSLTGRILYGLVDAVLVQWPALKERCAAPLSYASYACALGGGQQHARVRVCYRLQCRVLLLIV